MVDFLQDAADELRRKYHEELLKMSDEALESHIVSVIGEKKSVEFFNALSLRRKQKKSA